MNSKKKMLIAISSFALIILATVVGVVAVLAAQHITIKSSIKVSYTVDDVVADVEVYAAKVNLSATSINWGTAQTVNFDVDYDNQNGETVSFSEFKLGKTECVVLKFVFNNNSSKGFSATLTKPAGTNVNIYYASSEAALLGSSSTTPTTVNVSGGIDATASYFAVIKVDDNTKDASFDGLFAWNMA